MDKYQVFYKNYFSVSDEDARMVLMKDFMLSLSGDELTAWIKYGMDDMVEAKDKYSTSKNEENLDINK
jgi:hypothetical protein